MTPSKINGDVSSADIVLGPLESLSDNPTPERIKEALVYVSQKYGLKENELVTTIQCESQFVHNNNYGDGKLAYGLAQFHKPTFDDFCKGNYYSAKDQLVCLAEMWQHGLQRHWSCWKKYFTN